MYQDDVLAPLRRGSVVWSEEAGVDVTTPWRVFISHTSELYRLPSDRSFVRAAEQAVIRAGGAIAEMSYLTASEDSPAQTSREAVQKADIYVAIVGFRYGTPVRDRPELSYTELEFDEATAAGKPRFIFLLGNETIGTRELLAEPVYAERQHAFRSQLLESGVTTTAITSPAELSEKLYQTLREVHPSTRLDRQNERDAVGYLDELTDVAGFDAQAVRQYRSQLHGAWKADLPDSLSDLDFIERAAVMRGGFLTRSGVLLFGEYATNAMPSALVQCTEYHGETRSSPRDRLDITANVQTQIVEAYEFIATRTRQGEAPDGHSARLQPTSRYPMKAVREIIANALVHRRYDITSGSVHVRLFSDRIEISSPGPWGGRALTPENEEDLRKFAGESRPRNFRLARLMSGIKLVEGEGSGIPTSVEDCAESGAPQPRVLESDGFVRVSIFPRPQQPTATRLDRIWSVPARNAGFTGREDLLIALREALDATESEAVQAVHGMGGVGKTTLVLEYAHRYGSSYDLAWWVPAQDPTLIPERLAEFSRALGLSEARDTTGVAVARLLGALRDRSRWLLVFDNAEDPATLPPFLPGGAGHVVITSRNPGWRDLAGALPVEVFDRDDSMFVLRDRVPTLPEDLANEIGNALGDLPLAIAQAAAFLNETGMDGRSYLNLLTTHADQVLTRGQPTGYNGSVAASWALAFERLAVDAPAGLLLMSIAARLAPEPIPLTVFTSGLDLLPEPLAAVASDPLAMVDLTQLLRRRALASIDTNGVQLHRLVQTLLIARPTDPDLPHPHQVAVGLLRTCAPKSPWNNPAQWPAWRLLLPHILTAVSPTSGIDTGPVQGGDSADDISWLLDRGATYLHTRGDPRAARPLFERAYRLRRDQHGADHPDTLNSANNLARDVSALGEYAAAHALDEDTLTRCRAVLGEDHPDTLLSANNLADDLDALGDHASARQLDEHTLELRRRVLGDDHPDTLTSASNLARDLAALGDYPTARALEQDTLARRKQVLGQDHPDTLWSAHNLAVDLLMLGDPAVARDLDQDTWNRRKRVLGENHPDTLWSAHNLAVDWRTIGDHAEARDLGEDTLTRRQRTLGDDHPATLTTAHDLVVDLRALGEHAAARTLNEDTFDRRRRVLGDDDPDTLVSARELVANLRALDDNEAADRSQAWTDAHATRQNAIHVADPIPAVDADG